MLIDSGCARWHDAGSSDWLDGTYCGFRRGENGVFYFSGLMEWEDTKFCGRGVAVVGAGL